MPRSAGRGRGHGCLVTLFALALAVAALVGAAWYLGLFDRAAYVASVEPAPSAESGEAAAPPRESGYVYAQLAEEDQRRYVILLDALRTRERRPYPETTMDELTRIRDCVLADHPELFAVNGVRLQTESNRGSGLVTNVQVSGQYWCDEEQERQLQDQLQAAADECLQAAPAGDDYAKAKYVFEYLVNTVEYDHDGFSADDEAAMGQTAVDALVGRSAVCAGYARAFNYLMGRLGVTCVYVTGTAGGEDHAWCAALLDGSWYLVDPTWGDPSYGADGGVVSDSGRVNYDYLCVTQDDLAPTHQVDAPYGVPACVSLDDNYYVREGLYLSDADIERAGAIISDALGRGDAARFRCATREGYGWLVSELFSGQQVYRFISGDSCRYFLNDELLTVEVFE